MMNGVAGIRQVTVVGAGIIGASWTALFLAKGFSVAITDTNPEAESKVKRFVEEAWPALTVLGLAPGAAPDKLRFDLDLASACDGADFVQENATERELLKVALFAEIDSAVRRDVLIASSSSALTVTTMQRECRHPERVVLGHPFNPPHLMPLVEIVGGEQTSAGALDRAETFYAALGKTPVRLAKEVYGHIANRLQGAVFREAVSLLDKGVASLADIDRAMTDGPGLRWALMGPFLTYHLAGGEGGMGAFMKQFALTQTELWKDLGEPVIDERLQRVVTEAMEHESGGRSISDFSADRDRRILALLTSRDASERATQAQP